VGWQVSASESYSRSVKDDDEFEVGQRVRTTTAPHATGEIVDDFGTLAGTEVVVDSLKTVRSRRWAVQLDDGGLKFVDDQDIEHAP
jgi:hypothetical protein